MCGIVGILDLDQGAPQAWLEAMAATLARRGPDDAGYLRRGPAGLAHRRLSIIDLAGGHQRILNEDESLAIVANGELYDYSHWKQQLEEKGHRFRTASDSEVLLHLYEEYGPVFLHEANGMFAFAILDLRQPRLFLARDRFGKKPLFLCRRGDRRIAFASGPAALATLPWVPRDLNLAAIHDYLEYQYLPTPCTVYQAIEKLPPHHWGRWDNGQWHQESYWEPRLEPSRKPPADLTAAATELRAILTAAVQRRLVADVPVGVFLSGGMDSSITTALAQQLSGARRIQSFSIGFPESKYDERVYAEQVARHLGTDHHFLEVHPGDFQRLEELVEAFEEPFADASMLPTALLAEFTRRHVTVALSGDGADELFGGYERYRVMHLLAKLDRIPCGLRNGVARTLLACLPPKLEERTASGRLHRLLELVPTSGVERYRALLSRFSPAARLNLYGDNLRAAVPEAAGLDVLARHFRPELARHEIADAVSETDLASYLPDDILVKVDRAAMAFALEVRSPFLDRDVAAFALTLPYAWKQRGGESKRLLRAAFADLLPAAIFDRPKMGFGVPLARWFRQEWKKPVAELLPNGRAVQLGLFRGDAVRALLAEHNAPRADHSYALFAILVLELWLRRHAP